MPEKICLINGSPRGLESGSQIWIEQIGLLLNGIPAPIESITIIQCQQTKTEELAFATMAASDCLVFVFPLYIDSIPSHMLDFMIRFEAFLQKRYDPKEMPRRVYAVVNNGFIEGMQNRIALRIMRHFSRAIGAEWRFGIGIGAGEFLRETHKSIPLQSRIKRSVYEALLKLRQDITNEETACQKDLFVQPAIAPSLFMLAGSLGWIQKARGNGLKRKSLKRRVYQE